MAKQPELVLHVQPQSESVSEDGKWAVASVKYWTEGVPGSDKILYYEVPIALHGRLFSTSNAWILVFMPLVIARKGKMVFHGSFSSSVISESLQRVAGMLSRSQYPEFKDAGEYVSSNLKWLTVSPTNDNPPKNYSWPGSERLRGASHQINVEYVGPNIGSTEAFRQDSVNINERIFIHGLHLPLERETALASAIRHYEGINALCRIKAPVYYTRTNIRSLYTDPVHVWILRPLFEVVFGHVSGFDVHTLQVYHGQSFAEDRGCDILGSGFSQQLADRGNGVVRLYFGGAATNIQDRFHNLSSNHVLKYARHCMEPTDEYTACNKCRACSQLRMALKLYAIGNDAESSIFGLARFNIVDALLSQMGEVAALPNPTTMDNLIVSLVNADDNDSAEFVNAALKIVSSKSFNSAAWAKEKVAELTKQYLDFSSGKQVTLLTQATVVPR